MIRPCLIALLSVASSSALYAQAGSTPGQQRRAVVSRSSRILERQGLRFKDLNKNGVLDPYEDWRLSPSARAGDLVRRMTLGEKAGMMMHGTARSAGPPGVPGAGAAYDTTAIGKLIRETGVNSFITRLSGDPRSLAAQNNSLQEMAESTRLGIPATISTDPRNHFQNVAGASVRAGRFSQWPETLGFAAIGDAALVRRFADIARQEYRSVGIQETLSPQADLATEPRWSRINGTFGEDPDLARNLVKAYVEGFQHGKSGVDSAGVLAVVKHWVGYGAQKNGFDSHSSYGRFASFSGGLDTHIKPFLGAFAAHVGGVMPTYSILEGATLSGRRIEQVGAGFNRQLLTDVLRKRYHFQGIVLTDWAITNDCADTCRNGFPAGQRPSFAGLGMPWGVEDLSKVDRFAKAVNAGVDQFGGTEEAEFVVQAVRSGKIAESRINESAYRIALQKFRQGLFENPYVDTAEAGRVVGNARFQDEANAAQRRSLVLLENKNDLLPLSARGKRVFLHGVDSATAAKYGFTVVADLSQAEIAIVRTDAPFQTLHPSYVFGAMQHEGDLGFRNGNAEFEEIKRITAAVPTIVTVYLDRPAILTEMKSRASALVANFGVSDAALLDVLTGVARPEGRLPFELPSSMQEVEAQRSDVPHDTPHPLYRIVYGLRYSRGTIPAAAQTAPAPVPADSLDLEPYSLRTYDGQTHDIELGKLTVPETRVHRTGRSMSVAFFRLKSTSPTPGSPIVFLMGGPGIPASVMAPIPPYWQLFDALRAAGDVILLDQRGLGLSSPKVDCPPLAQPLATNFLTSHAAFIAGYRRVLASCAAHWRSKDVDPRAFTDAEIADDVDDIRRALGAQRVSLLGFSYGTRLAMTFARRHPDRLDRIALQGPTDADLEYRESLTYDSLLTRLARLAVGDTVSAPYSADLFARTRALFARADRGPIALKIHRTSGDSVTVRVGGDVLRGLVAGRVTDVRVPALVATMERGDNSILTRWVEGLYNDFNAGGGTLMARAVNCSSAPSDARRARVDAAVAGSIFGGAFDNFAADWAFCGALGGDPAKASSHLRAPLESPALFVTGELDDRTPIGNDLILSREFRETIRVRVLNGGHELLPDRPVRELVTEFFLGRDVRNRSIRLAPPRFLSIEAAKLPPRRPGQ